ncbi:MAG TPA: HD domain-containing phosphohydrolase [Vicinamibacterales bacterium]|nr:HD domain-containing phosphohydrolase [Vicinamibacterales bacterium]
MRFELVVRSGKEVGRTVTIDSGQTITLGRLKGCDMVVDDEAASRRHCTITGRDTVCVVTDLQSANGTFVNEKRIAAVELQRGDNIRIGSTVIELVDIAQDGASAARPGVHTTTSLSIVEARSNTLVQRAVDPTKLEFLSQVYKRKDEAHLLESAQKYLTTLHKVSDILSRASSVEALFDSILSAILEVTGGDRAAILMRNKDNGQVDLMAVRTRDGNSSGEVKVSRSVVNDVLEKGISAFTDDAMADDRYIGGESIVRQRIRSVMCAPMRTTDEILGVLYVDSQMAREFSEAELELLAAVGNQSGIALHRARLMAEVERLFLDVMKAIASIIDAKDGYTHKHSERVAAFGVRLARHLGFDADGRAVVELSGLLHDVGKIGVPDAILNKPGKLTDSEFKEMRLHPLHGARILSNIQSEKVVNVLPGVKYHHERWDGNGYPEGLKGEEIPLLGRVLGVADFLDALTSDRSYRKGLPLEEALQMVKDLEGQAFDPTVVKAAVELHERGELALPTAPNPGMSVETPVSTDN